MRCVDYDAVAATFDRRYDHNAFGGVERAVRDFIGERRLRAILEIGCGTGHWLNVLADTADVVAGADLSFAMLEQARRANPRAGLVRATAEYLPYADGVYDRAFCVNALHHFRDQRVFIHECRRVLSSSGAFLTIALDPHTGIDQWWVYDYFPGALLADLERYSSTEHIRRMLSEAGFARAATWVVHHVPAERPFDVALARGHLDRRSTSQLMVIDDAEWDRGIERMHEERPVLRSNLRLYATLGRVTE